MTTDRQPARRSCSPTCCAVRTLLTVSVPSTSSGAASSPPRRARIASAQRRTSARLSSSLVSTTCGRSSLIRTTPTGVLRMPLLSGAPGAGTPLPLVEEDRDQDERADNDLQVEGVDGEQ